MCKKERIYQVDHRLLFDSGFESGLVLACPFVAPIERNVDPELNKTWLVSVDRPLRTS